MPKTKIRRPKHARPDDLPVWKNTLGLYLDISKKNTGYAVMLGLDLMHHGAESFQSHKRDGPMLAAWRDWLEETLDLGEFDLIGFEYVPFQRGRALELWHSMFAILKLISHDRDIPLLGIHPGQIKIAAGNHHQATKEQVIAGINKRYDLSLKSHDIADAIGCGLAASYASAEDGNGKWI